MLINELQWVGIIVQPIDYSLKDAVLHIDTGPGLKIEDSYAIEMESFNHELQNTANIRQEDGAREKDSSNSYHKNLEQLILQNGRIEFPEWASCMTSILWIPIRAISSELARGSSSGS